MWLFVLWMFCVRSLFYCDSAAVNNAVDLFYCVDYYVMVLGYVSCMAEVLLCIGTSFGFIINY